MQQSPQPLQPLSNSKSSKTKLPFQYLRTLVHFKNCIHDGFFTSNMKRQGPGITILDNGTVILGNYRNDQNNSMCLIWIDMGTYFIGQFNKGALDGPFVVRAPSITFYSSFTNNKIQGELLIIDYNNCVSQLWAIDASGQGQICKELNLSQISNWFINYEEMKRAEGKLLHTYEDKTKFISEQQVVLKTMAPYIEKKPNVIQFIKTIKSGSQEFQGMGPQIFSHKIYQNNQLIMLNSNSTQNNFLGFVMNKRQELTAYGEFQQIENVEKVSGRERVISYQYNYQLNGIGIQVLEIESGDRRRDRTQKIILSGRFKNNQLHGQACKQIQGQKIIYGKFAEGSIRNADIIKIGVFKDEEIKKLELRRNRNIHIHSLNFHNNYCNERPTFLIRNLIEMMTNDNNEQFSEDY